MLLSSFNHANTMPPVSNSHESGVGKLTIGLTRRSLSPIIAHQKIHTKKKKNWFLGVRGPFINLIHRGIRTSNV